MHKQSAAAPAVTMYRQGDVLIVRISELPKGCKPDVRDQGRIILAYGEVTGHAHALSAPDTIVRGLLPTAPTRVLDAQVERFLHVISRTDVTHEEHDAITLVPGYYAVVRQREYVAGEVPRYVAD